MSNMPNTGGSPTSGQPPPGNNQDLQFHLYPNGQDEVNSYDFHPGVFVCPLAEEEPTDPSVLANWSPVIIAKVHASYRIRRARTQTYKINNPPIVPSPDDTGAFVFLSGNIQVKAVANQTMVSFDWLVHTNYLFVEDCVSRPQDGLVLGSPPWTWQVQSANLAQYGAAPPQLGAIAFAGVDALIGYGQGLAATQNMNTGLGVSWGYNTPSFFSGAFFSADMLNGGAQVAPDPPPNQG